MNCCGAGFGIDVGVGLGDPERGSGWRVRVGVGAWWGLGALAAWGAANGGRKVERLFLVCWKVTVGVGMMLTYCQRS